MAPDPDKTKARRVALAEAVLQEGFTQIEFAKTWQCSQTTVSADMRSKEFQEARNGPLAAASLQTIFKKTKEGNLQAALYVADKLHLIEPDDAGEGSPAQDALKMLFEPNAALQRENAQLRERLAVLEERVTRINGG